MGNPWIEWYQGNDTGVSSETIWTVMTGYPVRRSGVPWDPSDFGRCYRLLERFPEWRTRLSELAEAFPQWVPLVREWDRLTAIYLRDVPTGRSDELWRELEKLNTESGALNNRRAVIKASSRRAP